jgi:hypothetical protein
MRGSSAFKPSGSRKYPPPALAEGFRSELLRRWIEVKNERVSSGAGNVPKPALSHRNEAAACKARLIEVRR